MTGVTHLAAGALSSLLLLSYSPYHIFYLLLSALGGLFPDMDASEAKIHHLGFRITRRFRIKPFLIPAKIISAIFRHRGWIHSLLGLVIFSFLLGIVLFQFTLDFINLTFAFAFGYLSHLLTDSMTISGIPFFYPFSKRNFHLLPRGKRIQTNGRSEKFFELFFLLIFGFTFIGLLLTGHIQLDAWSGGEKFEPVRLD